jgi:hypothetical protein
LDSLEWGSEGENTNTDALRHRSRQLLGLLMNMKDPKVDAKQDKVNAVFAQESSVLSPQPEHKSISTMINPANFSPRGFPLQGADIDPTNIYRSTSAPPARPQNDQQFVNPFDRLANLQYPIPYQPHHSQYNSRTTRRGPSNIDTPTALHVQPQPMHMIDSNALSRDLRAILRLESPSVSS